MSRALARRGFKVEAFGSAELFLEHYANHPGCLVLDLRLPGMDGLELMKALRERGKGIPIIFMSGHSSAPESVQVMGSGAIEFLEKPFIQATLLDRITEAFEKDRQMRAKE